MYAANVDQVHTNSQTDHCYLLKHTFFPFFQNVENEMDIQVQRFEELNDRGADLVSLLGNDPVTVDTINNQLQHFQERWDSLVQKMEYQSKQVRHWGPQ